MATVMDAFRFFSEFETAEFFQDRFGKDEVPEEDQCTISDLFARQIEFANVVIFLVPSNTTAVKVCPSLNQMSSFIFLI